LASLKNKSGNGSKTIGFKIMATKMTRAFNHIKLFATMAIIMATVLTIKASPIDSLIKANEYYGSNEFEKAINLYEWILAEGYQSPATLYNLGNSYYKIGNVTRAILNYERAKLLAPHNEDIGYNLELANQYIVDKIEPIPAPFFLKWRESVINLFDADGWANFSLISFITMLIFALLFFLSRSIFLKKISFAVAIALMVVAAFSYSFASHQRFKIDNRNFAIIITPTVTVKASPNQSGTDLFVIHEGLKVNIANEVNNWMEIKLEDGNSGWVQSAVLERI
jgi:tetratricopeptide (TPR) repeat protein